jgi:hypothetical protein
VFLKIRRVYFAAITVVVVMVVTVGQAQASTGQSRTPAAVRRSSAGTVLAAADWGVDTGGKPRVRVESGTLVERPANSTTISTVATARGVDLAAPSWHCHEEIDGFNLGGAGPSFRWWTEQICTGAFKSQDLKTQLWRSSWSGPRGYGSWVYSDVTFGTQLGPLYWSIKCHVHAGYYDYYPVMRGYNTAGGWGPTVRSSRSVRHQPCGPGPA